MTRFLSDRVWQQQGQRKFAKNMFRERLATAKIERETKSGRGLWEIVGDGSMSFLWSSPAFIVTEFFYSFYPAFMPELITDDFSFSLYPDIVDSNWGRRRLW